MLKASKKFTVEGSGCFPMDMLRYDQADFATERDRQIAAPDLAVIDQIHLPQRQVLVISQHKPTVARWHTFGWKVR